MVMAYMRRILLILLHITDERIQWFDHEFHHIHHRERLQRFLQPRRIVRTTYRVIITIILLYHQFVMDGNGDGDGVMAAVMVLVTIMAAWWWRWRWWWWWWSSMIYIRCPNVILMFILYYCILLPLLRLYRQRLPTGFIVVIIISWLAVMMTAGEVNIYCIVVIPKP